MTASVTRLDELDRFCSVVFDEMSIKPGLYYDTIGDTLVGLENFGSTSTASFADHALVFMVRGLYRNWKQPVAFTFCKGTTSTVQLVALIKDIVGAVNVTGLKIVATISDQGATNRAAIRQLSQQTKVQYCRAGREFRSVGYEIDGREIFHIWDAPHLIKGCRNNLLNKNVHFFLNKPGHLNFFPENIRKFLAVSDSKLIASWLDIMNFYKFDCDNFRICGKLTDYHILPNRIKKMKVSNCTQVLSYSVGAGILSTLRTQPNEDHKLDSAAVGTGALCIFFDKLFDSINGSSLYPPPNKPLKCVLSRNSAHISHWDTAIDIMTHMRFLTHNARYTSPPICCQLDFKSQEYHGPMECSRGCWLQKS